MPRTGAAPGWCSGSSRSPPLSTSAHDLAQRSHLVFVCPRYEGVDDRIRSLVDLELSIGDYILTGGELPALVVIDAVLRLLPGAIDAASTAEESFAGERLEYPQFTRPPEFRGSTVPAVLVSGHHGEVDRWRRAESLRRTMQRRPDLLERRPPEGDEAAVLERLRAEAAGSGVVPNTEVASGGHEAADAVGSDADRASEDDDGPTGEVRAEEDGASPVARSSDLARRAGSGPAR
jgi:hypothetical protein